MGRLATFVSAHRLSILRAPQWYIQHNIHYHYIHVRVIIYCYKNTKLTYYIPNVPFLFMKIILIFTIHSLKLGDVIDVKIGR